VCHRRRRLPPHGERIRLHPRRPLGLGLAIALAAGLVAGYAVVGLLADAVTDVVRGVAVLSGLLVLGVVAAVGLGGVSLFGSEQDWLSIAEQLPIPCAGRSSRSS